jgi:hypothetical protein
MKLTTHLEAPMRVLLLVALAILMPTLALASGELAPRQAVVDIEATCQGPSWSVFGLDRGDTSVEEATGMCFDFASGHGVTAVQWARGLITGHRVIFRLDVDPTYVPVPASAPTLTCTRLGGFELCR